MDNSLPIHFVNCTNVVPGFQHLPSKIEIGGMDLTRYVKNVEIKFGAGEIVAVTITFFQVDVTAEEVAGG